MEDKAQKGLKEQRERKKRIKRIKTGIVLTIVGWMLLSMIICIFLLVRVHSLEDKMDILLTGSAESTEVSVDNHANSPEITETENSGGEDEDAVDETTDEEDIMASSITVDEANLADEGDKLKVYLTFDDGPSDNTAEILDILNQYNVKATFFVIGKEDDTSKAMYQRIVNEGHTLAMHSYTHKYSEIYSSLDAFENDVTTLRNYLYDVTGIECKYYRFPGGSSNQVSNTDMSEFIRYLNGEDITYFDWNVSSGDATSQAYTPAELVQNVMNDVTKYKTSVVLMHDAATKDTTVEALGTMIETLQQMGVELLPIDDNTTLVQHVSADSVD